MSDELLEKFEKTYFIWIFAVISSIDILLYNFVVLMVMFEWMTMILIIIAQMHKKLEEIVFEHYNGHRASRLLSCSLRCKELSLTLFFIVYFIFYNTINIIGQQLFETNSVRIMLTLDCDKDKRPDFYFWIEVGMAGLLTLTFLVLQIMTYRHHNYEYKKNRNASWIFFFSFIFIYLFWLSWIFLFRNEFEDETKLKKIQDWVESYVSLDNINLA